MKLSEHFTLEELISSITAKNKGIKNVPNDTELKNLKDLAINVLEPLRIAYNKPIRVSSGYRCSALNKLVGGSKTSQHVLGQAADITSLSDTIEDNKELFDVALKLIAQGKIRVGQVIDEYNYNWVHISIPYKNVNQILHIK